MTNSAYSYCPSKIQCMKFSNEIAQSLPYSAGLFLALLCTCIYLTMSLFSKLPIVSLIFSS